MAESAKSVTRVYRLTRQIFADNPFDGEGSYRYGGRWSSPGTRLVYAADHQSLAMLEYLAHLDPNDVPDDLVFAQADIPDSVSRRWLTHNDLPQGWDSFPAPEALRIFGDRFASRPLSGEKPPAILIVPSALAPTECNWLLNPYHRDFGQILIQPSQRFQYDRRLLS